MTDASSIDRQILWQPYGEPGLEHLHLIENHLGVEADGWVIGIQDGSPFRLAYQVRCDPAWHVRGLEVRLISPTHGDLILSADENGHWTAGDGEDLHSLDGCSDVDISVTPFTNTLPIRRLSWQPGVSADLLVVYIPVPELRAVPVRQRYTCLAVGPEGTYFRYEDEGLFPGFVAELRVDADGLVLDYAGLFRRVY